MNFIIIFISLINDARYSRVFISIYLKEFCIIVILFFNKIEIKIPTCKPTIFRRK